jgi:TolA-binding protein
MLNLHSRIIGISLGFILQAGLTTGAVANDRIPPFPVSKAFNLAAVRQGAGDSNVPAQEAQNLSLAANAVPQTMPDTLRAAALLQTAAAMYRAGDWQGVEIAYRQFLHDFPNAREAASAHLILGYKLSFSNNAKDKEAASHYAQAIAKARDRETTHMAKVNLAGLHYAWGEYDKACDLFREVAVESRDWAMIKYATRQLKTISLKTVPPRR